LRAQALGWLRAGLDAWSQAADKGSPQARAQVQRTLTHWHKDAALAGLRDPDALAKLPQTERQAWRTFWADADALLKRTAPAERVSAWTDRKGAAPPPGPGDAEWAARVSKLTAWNQAKAVSERLRERNPGFDGRMVPRVEGGVVTGVVLKPDVLTDLTPIAALKGLEQFVAVGSFTGFYEHHNKLTSLLPLQGLRLKRLRAAVVPVSDLRPLRGMPLEEVDVHATRVADLEPLRGMRLKRLDVGATLVKDLSPVQGMPLERLSCHAARDVRDLSPLRGMHLKDLTVAWTGVADLSPLAGMPLQRLGIESTGVKDLTPLKGMPLEELDCRNTRVTDLSPLKDLPLRILRCDFRPERDAAILRGIKTLRKINDKPVAEFWKEVDARKP
jgi:hypothetical protein